MAKRAGKAVEEIEEPSDLARYKEEIKYYEKEAGPWEERGRKILRRYKDERSPREQKIPRFNILYSNTQTLLPAIYGRNPKADIERRFKDKDPLGRVASDVLERCTDYFVNSEEFRASLRNALLDRLLPGRGLVWSRYIPHFRDVEYNESEEVAFEGLEVSDDNDLEPLEEVYYEEAVTDYVPWQDFGHNWARTWDEINLAWRRVYLDQPELKKRFKDKWKQIPLDYFPKGLNDQKKETSRKKAVIYELWDKTSKTVYWLHKDVPGFLDEKPDPLKLPDFWPFPKPLYAVLANDSMIPIPDYSEYQDQALELDELTSRIASITKCIKVAGVYDASAAGVERLLAEGVENKMIPVSQWAIHSEKGGLKGVMDLLPVADILKTLLGLYEARDKVKGDLYEITGIADILRGESDAKETATAQGIKARFATLRLGDSQDEMARFARDAVRNTACIIAGHFSLDTIKKISGVKLLTDMEKQQLQMQIQMQQQQAARMQPPPQPGQPVAPPPKPQIDDDTQEMLDNPTWEQIDALFKDEPALCFKIDIEIDSTIKTDEEEDKASAVEFLKAAGEFMGAMKEAPPIAQPLLAHLLMFGVRKFRAGKQVEGQFEIFANKIEKMAANAPANPPDPEMVKAQAEAQQMQQEHQFEMQKMQQQNQIDRENDARDQERQRQNDLRDAALEKQKADREYQLKIAEMKADFELKVKEMQMKSQDDVKKHQMTTEAASRPVIQLDTDGMLNETSKKVNDLAENMAKHAEGITKATQLMATGVDAMVKHATKPKKIRMQRSDGSVMEANVE